MDLIQVNPFFKVEFPSPCGEWVGKVVLGDGDCSTLLTVSVPLRGMGWERQAAASIGDVNVSSFRPLAGNGLGKPGGRGGASSHSTAVSVPLRGMGWERAMV